MDLVFKSCLQEIENPQWQIVLSRCLSLTKQLKLVLHSLKVSVTVPDSGSLNTFSLELHESSLKVSKGGNINCAF